MEIYTDKAQGKAVIVVSERELEDLRGACIAYSTDWDKTAEEKTNEYEKATAKEIAEKFSWYWGKLYDAGKPFRNEE